MKEIIVSKIVVNTNGNNYKTSGKEHLSLNYRITFYANKQSDL